MGYTWDILILILFINDAFLRVPSRWGHDSVHRPRARWDHPALQFLDGSLGAPGGAQRKT